MQKENSEDEIKEWALAFREQSNNILHRVAQNPESLKILLELLPEENRLEAVKEKNKDGKTVLALCKKHTESWLVILRYCKSQDLSSGSKVFGGFFEPENLQSTPYSKKNEASKSIIF